MTDRLEHATALVASAVEAARAQGLAVAAVVTDTAGNIVAAARMDGAGHVAFEAARKKALCAASFGLPTHDFIEAVLRDERLKAVVLADASLNILPGGVPLRDDGVVVGGFGVAGGFYLQDRAVAEYATGSVAQS